jgi:hypothetical protein
MRGEEGGILLLYHLSALKRINFHTFPLLQSPLPVPALPLLPPPKQIAWIPRCRQREKGLCGFLYRLTLPSASLGLPVMQQHSVRTDSLG